MILGFTYGKKFPEMERFEGPPGNGRGVSLRGCRPTKMIEIGLPGPEG